MSDIYGYTFANGVTHPVARRGRLMLSTGDCCCNGCWLLHGAFELWTHPENSTLSLPSLEIETMPTWRTAHLYVDGYEILRVFPRGHFGADDIPSCGDREGSLDITTAQDPYPNPHGDTQATYFLRVDVEIRRGHSVSIDAQCTARCRYVPEEPTFWVRSVIQPQFMRYTDLNIKTTVDCGALGVCTSIIPAGSVAPVNIKSNTISVPQNMDGQIIAVKTTIEFYE